MTNHVDNCVRCGQRLFPVDEQLSQEQYETRIATGAHENCDLAGLDEDNHAFDFDSYGHGMEMHFG